MRCGNRQQPGLAFESVSDPPSRIHLAGGPGSGKTSLAERLASLVDTPVHDLDGMALDLVAQMPKPTDLAVLLERREAEVARLAAAAVWISEGSFVGPAETMLKRAELIVCLDVPWRVASYRILLRHLKLSIGRRNRFPGLFSLYRFWRWSARYYANRNPSGLNAYGAPNTQVFLAETLARYECKLLVCRTKRDIEGLLARLQGP